MQLQPVLLPTTRQRQQLVAPTFGKVSCVVSALPLPTHRVVSWQRGVQHPCAYHYITTCCINDDMITLWLIRAPAVELDTLSLVAYLSPSCFAVLPMTGSHFTGSPGSSVSNILMGKKSALPHTHLPPRSTAPGWELYIALKMKRPQPGISMRQLLYLGHLLTSTRHLLGI